MPTPSECWAFSSKCPEYKITSPDYSLDCPASFHLASYFLHISYAIVSLAMSFIEGINQNKNERMRTIAIFVLSELFAIGDSFEGAVIQVPIGATITLMCPLLSQLQSDVQWNHIDFKTVISDGFDINPKIFNKSEYTKFEIVGNHSIGEYNLKIRKVEIHDRGVYRCDSEIDGKPESRFIHLIINISDYQTDISIDLNENTTNTYTQKTRGFSIHTWIIIFISAIFGLLILAVVVAVVLKTIRPHPNESVDNTNTERTETDPPYETINDTVVTNPHAPALPNIVSRLYVHPLHTERCFAHTSSSNVENVLYSLQAHSTIPDTLNVDKNLNNENNADSYSDISSTYSEEASLDLVYEAPYINHYQPLGRRLERVPHLILVRKLQCLKKWTYFDEAMAIKTDVVFVLTTMLAIGENFEKMVIPTTIGETITLKCPPLAHNMSAQWVHLDTNKVLSDGWQINPKLYNESSSPKFEITGNPWEYNLKINDVDNKDKGNYKCDTEKDGKPMSKFFSLVIREYQQNNCSEEYSTEINYQKPEGFSIYQWIMIFMVAIVCIFILPLVVAGVLKVKRSNHGRNAIDTDTERAPEFLYETINDTGVIRAPSSGSPRSNVTILRPNEHSLGSKRSVTLGSGSNSVPSRSYATQLSVHIPDIFFDNTTNSETSSTQSLDKTLGLVYEPQYINDYHP
ncbi:unnamed protein product [Mytilus edulis]|uniref:Ig-like domain-containing protein n=1 Tax=Mytilus edulis TaxID=6550 RepID=A0A8S3VMT2_MYTED|nr:unnamed protein product [Mytilus edulis]